MPLSGEELTGTYNATEPKMFCMQKNYLMPNPTVMGVEDCLHLYVYRPKVSACYELLTLTQFFICEKIRLDCVIVQLVDS